MNTSIKILALATVLLLAQACGSKIEKSTEEAKAVEATAEKTAALSVEERRAQIEKDMALLIEKRKVAREKLAIATPTYIDPSGNTVYHSVEVNPSFIGGDKAMMEFLRDNVVYPKAAMQDNLEGTVFVDFVVGTDGVVRGIEVTDATSTAVDQSFRNEAIRVVQSMPKWLPGRQNDKPVNVQFSIPITFQMI